MTERYLETIRKHVSELDLVRAEQMDFVRWPVLQPGDCLFDPSGTFAEFHSIYDYRIIDVANAFTPEAHQYSRPNFPAPFVFLQTFGLASTDVIPRAKRETLKCRLCGQSEPATKLVVPRYAMGHVSDLKRYVCHVPCLAGRMDTIPCYWHPAYELFDRCQGVLVVTTGRSSYRVLVNPKAGFTTHVASAQYKPDHVVKVRSTLLADVWEAARSVWSEYVPEFPFGGKVNA